MIESLIANNQVTDADVRRALAASREKTFGGLHTDDSGGPFGASGVGYARYMGRWPEAITSLDCWVYIHGVPAVAGGGGDSLNWAELAIATGAYVNNATNISLTSVAFVSIHTVVTTIGATLASKQTIAVALPRDTDFWLIAAGAYQVTQVSYRIPTGSELLGKARSRAAYRPSLNLGTPLAFTGTPGTGFAVPWLRAELP